MKYLIALIISLFFLQCSQKNTRIHTSTSPALINISNDIKTIKLLDRTRPEKRKIINSIIKGKLLYETPIGISETFSSFASEINALNFFNCQSVTINKLKSTQNGSFPDPLDGLSIEEQYSGEYLLASLEVFEIVSSETFIQERKMQMDTNGNEYYIDIIRGTKVMRGKAGWRLYNSLNYKILDKAFTYYEYTYSEEGINKQNAREKLDSKIASSRNFVGKNLGLLYAQRISPIKNFVNRVYYARSRTAPELKKAKQYIKNKDWESAKEIWTEGLQSNIKEKDLAKLHYNLGVYYEREGNIAEAIKQLELSYSKNEKIARHYLEILRKINSSGY